MQSPSSLIVAEGIVVSCAICALPAAFISLGERPLVSSFSFFVIAFIHGMMLGVPAFWLLWWRKIANKATCTTAGVLIGTLPYAILFAPGMSGPGVNHVETLIQFALSGALIGFVFWIYVSWRTGHVAGQVPQHGSMRGAIVAPGFFKQVGNDELFRALRRGPSGNEYLRQAFKQARPEFESRRVRDLSIAVSAASSGPDHYLISVTNTGSRTYEGLRVHYEACLLDAENFGLDTTHMPSELARIPGEPIAIGNLPPGKTARIVRSGYGPHDQFDGPREMVLDLEYRLGGKSFTREDRRWSQVNIDLPNARGL